MQFEWFFFVELIIIGIVLFVITFAFDVEANFAVVESLRLEKKYY